MTLPTKEAWWVETLEVCRTTCLKHLALVRIEGSVLLVELRSLQKSQRTTMIFQACIRKTINLDRTSPEVGPNLRLVEVSQALTQIHRQSWKPSAIMIKILHSTLFSARAWKAWVSINLSKMARRKLIWCRFCAFAVLQNLQSRLTRLGSKTHFCHHQRLNCRVQ